MTHCYDYKSSTYTHVNKEFACADRPKDSCRYQNTLFRGIIPSTVIVFEGVKSKLFKYNRPPFCPRILGEN